LNFLTLRQWEWELPAGVGAGSREWASHLNTWKITQKSDKIEIKMIPVTPSDPQSKNRSNNHTICQKIHKNSQKISSNREIYS
jgi:hypothetical protein